MPLVSIIMPVYNAEKYLASSIDSVLAQTARDFELLLVNDGSKDSSLAICRDYEQRDSRVRVLDKPNGGVSSARNLGLDEAKGEWVMFIDSDDWLTEDALEECLKYVPEYDVIRFSFKAIHIKNIVVKRPIKAVSSPKQFLRLQLYRRGGLTVWGGLFRRSLYIDNKIYFNPDIIYGEDWLVSMQLTLACKKVKTLPNHYGYLYNVFNTESCTNTMTYRKVLNQLEVLKIIKERVGNKFRKPFRDTRCNIVNDVLRSFSPEETCEYLLTIRDKVYFINNWDVLWADISIRKKRRLWKFLRYCRAHGLK